MTEKGHETISTARPLLPEQDERTGHAAARVVQRKIQNYHLTVNGVEIWGEGLREKKK